MADASNHRLRAVSPTGVVTTFAGSGTAGTLDGTGTAARFNVPRALAWHPEGGLVGIDYGGHRIRRISAAGVVTTLAGSTTGFADGPSGLLNRPEGLAVGADGTVFVADFGGVRALLNGGLRTLVPSGAGDADGPALAARFNHPYGLALAPDGTLYVADGLNHRIRAISPDGLVSTVAGSVAGFVDATGPAARFNAPAGVAVGPDGCVYVADRVNHRIRKIAPGGVVTTLAGSTAGLADGTGGAARFNGPIGLAFDASGRLLVADTKNNVIRAVTLAGAVTTLAGSTVGSADGPAATAQFSAPQALVAAKDGTLYVAEGAGGNHRLRRISPAGEVSTLAGSTDGFADGVGAAARFSNPAGLALAADGSLVVAGGWDQRLRRVTPDGTVTTLAGGLAGYRDGVGPEARFDHPSGVAIAPDGTIFVADRNSHCIRQVR